ncbi:MAG: hypothetical protein AAGB19_12305 [Cyanobacteria bacterium P01_F01_bin.3]
MASIKQSIRAPVYEQLKSAMQPQFTGTFSDMVLAILIENRLLKETLSGKLAESVSLNTASTRSRPLEVVSVLAAPPSHHHSA